jgi:DNA-binding SARP family transcriptional activator
MQSLLHEVGDVIHFKELSREIAYFAPTVVVLYQNGDTRQKTLNQLTQLQRVLPAAPILLCTSSQSEESISARPRGVHACLQWPAEKEGLLKKARRLSHPSARLLYGLKKLFTSSIPASQPIRTDAKSAAYGFYINCLGRLQMTHNGKHLPALRSGIEQTLLTRLLLNSGRPILRKKLIQSFWPSSQEAAAKNCLNVAISHLRAYLKREFQSKAQIVFYDQSYSIQSECIIHSDVQLFTALYERAKQAESQGHNKTAISTYQQMSSLYRGHFLENINRENKWTEDQQMLYKETYLDCLGRLSTLLMNQSQYMPAVQAAEKILQIDPCVELAHRRIMKAYKLQGQRSKAIRQYILCQKTLSSELGLEPDADTKALFRKLINP